MQRDTPHVKRLKSALRKISSTTVRKISTGSPGASGWPPQYMEFKTDRRPNFTADELKALVDEADSARSYRMALDSSRRWVSQSEDLIRALYGSLDGRSVTLTSHQIEHLRDVLDQERE